jgi:hypothetical protein
VPRVPKVRGGITKNVLEATDVHDVILQHVLVV